MEEDIEEIEILNAFGRAGRTILKQDVIGEIAIILPSSSKNKRKDDVIKQGENDSTDVIKIPEDKNIETPLDFKGAYLKTWNSNYIFPPISKTVEVVVRNYLDKNYPKTSRKENDSKLFSSVEEYYKIKMKTKVKSSNTCKY